MRLVLHCRTRLRSDPNQQAAAARHRHTHVTAHHEAQTAHQRLLVYVPSATQQFADAFGRLLVVSHASKSFAARCLITASAVRWMAASMDTLSREACCIAAISSLHCVPLQ